MEQSFFIGRGRLFVGGGPEYFFCPFGAIIYVRGTVSTGGGPQFFLKVKGGARIFPYAKGQLQRGDQNFFTCAKIPVPRGDQKKLATGHHKNFFVVSGGGLPTVIHVCGAPLVRGRTTMQRRSIGGSLQTRYSTTCIIKLALDETSSCTMS